MTALRSTDGLARVYTLWCSRAGCPAYFNAPLAVRKASYIRRLAREAGWRAPTSKAKRGRDLCPDCKEKETT